MLFASIGAIGLVVHFLVLMALIEWLGPTHFVASQLAATLTAMASNFLLNNEITYRAYRYRGLAMAGGFALFALLCSVGAIANVDIASWLFKRGANLVGRRPRGRSRRRRLELRGEHDHRLAQAAPG